MTDQKQPDNVEYFSYLGCLTAHDATRVYETESRIAMAAAAFNKKKIIFTTKQDQAGIPTISLLSTKKEKLITRWFKYDRDKL